jgi:hypothetical protein
VGDFENATQCGPHWASDLNATCPAGSVFKWSKGVSTPSSGTGPSGGADGTADFVFVEATSRRHGDCAFYTSSNLSDIGATQVRFAYSMYSSTEETMGTLEVQVLLDKTAEWAIVWSKSRRQTPNASTWLQATVALPPLVVGARL